MNIIIVSVYPKLYNNQLPILFNSSDFNSVQYISNLQTDSLACGSINVSAAASSGKCRLLW